MNTYFSFLLNSKFIKSNSLDNYLLKIKLTLNALNEIVLYFYLQNFTLNVHSEKKINWYIFKKNCSRNYFAHSS